MDDVMVRPVGIVRGPRTEPVDDFWGGEIAAIELDSSQFGPDALVGLVEFSHLEVLFHLHQVDPTQIQTGADHPRGRIEWPKVGIFARRSKARPNRLALSRCRLLRVDGLALTVEGLDAIDGTPILDIKPYLIEFGPRGEVRQPQWATEMMRYYYADRDG
ncbi:MAG: SAM-dependent methyltransferase [candidate division Zixibacteria bacterium]|nr:SAM-dependent methyltransferase [candidate division Zixibacteria bacterium]